MACLRPPTVSSHTCACQVLPGVVESLKVTTRENSIKIAKFAFDYAVSHGRSKVTCVHKANIMCVLCCLACCRSPMLMRLSCGRAGSVGTDCSLRHARR